MDLSHRKVRKRMRLTDHQGNALTNCEVNLRQTNHAFLFGCGGFCFIPYVVDGREEFREVTQSWLEIFNYATLPFYWGEFEPVEGVLKTDALMKTARYMKSRGVKLKGHPLCWHTVCADWLMKYDNRTILEKQLERIDREVRGFQGVIDMWDVINEVVIMPVFDKYDNAVTRICREKGRVGLIREVFERAQLSNPEAVLLLNDFNTSVDYENLIDGCLNAGVPISAIGIQSHQHQGYWGREKLLDVLERFSRFGLPIHFTENTLISGSLMPEYIEDLNDWQVEQWPTTPEGEARQAEQIEEMYRILFSHPLVEAITAWDYMDGGWLKAPSGLIREDHTRKPSFDTLKRLVRQEWWTDTTLRTDEDGWLQAEVFKGDYRISCRGSFADASLLDDKNVVIAISDRPS